MNSHTELLGFLSKETRLDIKSTALDYILGLTGSKEGLNSLSEFNENELYYKLFNLMNDTSIDIAKKSSCALINLTSNQNPVSLTHYSDSQILQGLWTFILDPQSFISDPASMILSNISVNKNICQNVFDVFLMNSLRNVEDLIDIFCNETHNIHGAHLHYIASILSNLSQIQSFRKLITDKNKFILQRLLPFTEHSSIIRRGGIIGTLRNLCFDDFNHEWFLGPSVDLLPRLLLPLAGPTPESWTSEDIESLPLDLQYLGEDKVIEEDSDIRKMLLESLLQLCTRQNNRETLRRQQAYIILRELHKSETHLEVKLSLENLVDILIKREDEINVDNYKDVDIPSEMLPQFKSMDEEYLKN